MINSDTGGNRMDKTVTRAVSTAVSLVFLAASGGAASAKDHNRRNVQGGISTLAFQAQIAISQALGRDLAGFEVRAAQGGDGEKFEASSAKQKIAAGFNAEGVSLRTGSVAWGMALRAYGYGESLTPAAPVAPSARQNRVEYRRGPLTEWYANGPLGIEQGFTLSKRPAVAHGSKDGRGPLTVALVLHGNLEASVNRDGAGLTLIDANGKAVLQYVGL